MPSPVPPTEEQILEELLARLLESGAPEGDGVDAPSELLELRDMARRLRASVQWMPLPRSRLALRRALLATVEAARSRPAASPAAGHTPAAWRRTGRWLTTATAVTLMMVGAVLSAHALEVALSPTGPLYGITLQIDAMRVQLAGDAMHRAALLLQVTHARAAEVGAMAYGDDPRGVEEAAAALERETRWLRKVAKSLPQSDQQRFAPAATRSDTLVVAARRAAELRRRGHLPSGITMVDLLSAGSAPMSGAAAPDVSPVTDSPRGPSRGAGRWDGASRGDAGGGSTHRETGGALTDAGTAGGQTGAGLSEGSPSVSGGLSDSGPTDGGTRTISHESQKSGGAADAAPGSGSGVSAASGDRGGASSGGGQGDGGSSDGGHNR